MGQPYHRQMDEIGVASHGLPESLISTRRVGVSCTLSLVSRGYKWPGARCLSALNCGYA